MDLYQELILDHSKRKVGHGLREGHVAEVHHVNPTCGDEVTLRVHLDGTGQGDSRCQGHADPVDHGQTQMIGESGRSHEGLDAGRGRARSGETLLNRREQ